MDCSVKLRAFHSKSVKGVGQYVNVTTVLHPIDFRV